MMKDLRNALKFLTLLLVFCTFLAALPSLAGDRRVSGPQELQAELARSEGGVIVLAPGRYGDLVITGRHFTEPVILRSELPRRAIFDQILLQDSGNLTFEALTIRKQFRAEKSSALAVTDCRAWNMLYFRNIEGLQIENSVVSGGQYGVLFNSVSDFSIRYSLIGKVSEDIMRITGDSHDGLVEGNVLDDVIAYPPTHPDLIQMFGAGGKTPHDITIRSNFLHDLHETGSPKRTAQGIFMSDPKADGYRDILIENNVIKTRSANTIYINGGRKRVVVRNNTLLPGAGDGGAIIRIARKSGQSNAGTTITNNIAKRILDETKVSSIGSNYLYGRGARIDALFSGPGARWQDFLPIIGTGPDKPGLGATDFLKELLAAQKPGAKGGPRLGPDWTD